MRVARRGRQQVSGITVGVAGLAVAAATLAGCGGPGLSPGPGNGPGTSAGGPAALSVSTAHGLVVCRLVSGNTAIELEVLSSQNLHVEASTTIPAVPDQEPTNNLTSGPNAPLGCGSGQTIGYNPGTNIPSAGPEQFAARQRFNAGFTEMAVIIQKPSSGTADAGYINLATDKVTDLTRASSSGFTGTSFSAKDALFNPTTGDLWYLTSNGVPYSVDAAGHATAHPVSYASSLRGGGNDAPGYIALAPRSGWVLSDNANGLPNPSGTVAVGDATVDTGGQLRIWHQGSDLADILTRDKTLAAINVKGLPSGELPSGSQNPAPLAWLNDTQLIMLWGSQFYVVTFGHGFRSATAGHGLLPSNSNQYLQAMLSPDHHTLAFTVGNDVWELALNQPGAQPKKIGTLGSSSAYWAILDWR